MLIKAFRRLIGSRNDRQIRQFSGLVNQINHFEPALSKLSDDQLKAKTAEFKHRIEKGESLDSILPEAFATVREASQRALGLRHFDVQLMGGIALHRGRIAEMRTGEGKTLVATLPAYLNALTGQGVHIITVNDYLASRDSQWMGKLYEFLGLTTGVNLTTSTPEDKKIAYTSDITYGTNNEFGFDYLRDNMTFNPEQCQQRSLHYTIIDEVDSILIDEARTPLIISGQAEDNSDLYVKLNSLPPLLEKGEAAKDEHHHDTGDYTVDLKSHNVLLTDQGHEKAEEILARMGLLKANESLYEPQNISLMHHLYTALRAHALYFKDQHYVVQNNEIVIVDEFTGRLMSGRRWGEGLHQAVEAKESVPIQSENQTLASITFQNYFRLYDKLAGMTGTADTEAFEFHQIYQLETMVIPTHRPMARQDFNDKIYRTAKEKFQAIIDDVKDCQTRKQPVLIGTTSIENSELLSTLLNQEKLTHQVLNAKQHEKEAHIISQAGRPGIITIATNMAGRGTDIVLGGNIQAEIERVNNSEELSDDEKKDTLEALTKQWETDHADVLKSGGLHIIASERHESRRIDNQLRGRSGRQGDAGSSRFYLSLEDPLLKIFAGDRLNSIMQRLKIPEGEAIEHSLVNRSLETAQRKVEQRNFDIRKDLLSYDDVANEQRKVIYRQRKELITGEDDFSKTISTFCDSVVETLFRTYVPKNQLEEHWEIEALTSDLESRFRLNLPIRQWLDHDEDLDDQSLLIKLKETIKTILVDKYAFLDDTQRNQLYRNVMIDTLDNHWRSHLTALDHLRQGIHLRGYAQKNPKQEYKREAFELFSDMLNGIRLDIIRFLLSVKLKIEAPEDTVDQTAPARSSELPDQLKHSHETPESLTSSTASKPSNDAQQPSSKMQPIARQLPKVGRNEPCPCASGKKYKHCHGR